MSDRKPKIGILGIMQDLYDDMIPDIAARQRAMPVRSLRTWRTSRIFIRANRSSTARTPSARCASSRTTASTGSWW
jgi:hypothetical protein